MVDAGDTPFLARTDPDKVRQILFSLLGNAVKFTDRGEIRLTLRAEGDRAVLEVADTGIGIAAGEPGARLRAFLAGRARRRRARSGDRAGPGPPAPQRWTLGGDVRARSEPGRGSTFRVTIPLG